MIEKAYRTKHKLTCDNCGKCKEFDSWTEVITFMGQKDFEKFLKDGEWKHYCKDCNEEGVK